MLGHLALLFFVVPIAEIAVLIQVGQVFGVGPTILALIGLSLLGAWLAKREGIAVWKRFMATLSQGRIPSAEIQDGALVLFGAALLLTPGFLTDLLGLALLIPGLRVLLKPALVKAGKTVAGRRLGGRGARRSRVHVVHATVTPREDPESDSTTHRRG